MSTPPLSRARRLRPEIQALRAIAVGLVVLFHFFPTRLPGGFVGVDVFFVISGFLITGNLLREAGRTGRIRYGRFLLRRAKRLLPASLLVTVSAAVAIAVWVPRQLWDQFYSEVVAATLYTQNWLLAANSVDYLAANNQASPVQHFWTLSVEEQFYLVMPLLLILAMVLLRDRWRVAAGWCLAAIFVASLIYSVVLTQTDHSVAYFSTGTRAWEFAAGSLLAYLGWRAPVGVRTAVSLLGMAVIGGCGFLMNGTLPFPGVVAAIPVAGTVLVLWAGMPSTLLGAVYRLKPIQWLGGVSYSLYLWHWPILVLFPFVVGHRSTLPQTLALIALSVLLAALSKYVVEDPFLGIKHRYQHAITLGTAWVGVVAVLILATGFTATARAQARAAEVAAQAAATAHAECFGAMAMRPDAHCPPGGMPPVDPVFAKTDAHGVESGDCTGGVQLQSISDGEVCLYGDPKGTRSIAVVGDSHARQWVAPLDELAKAKHMKLVTYVHPSCPMALSPIFTKGAEEVDCTDWVKGSLPSIAALKPAVVVDAALVPAGYYTAQLTMDPLDKQVAAHQAAIDGFLKDGAKVAVITDTPYEPQDVPNCVAANPEAQSAACAGPRATVLTGRPQPLLDAAKATPGVAVLDLSDRLCTPTECPVVIGGVIVYKDRHHLTKTYADSLLPFIESQLATAHIV
ncbi:acyltransferase family protein [Leifsonia sp. NPDC056824]|uniref:acyltransferase family protein n=1 Tax=Leifsonia sp. NPDC056824 TaxID=3345953 RepID=UPI0036C39397